MAFGFCTVNLPVIIVTTLTAAGVELFGAQSCILRFRSQCKCTSFSISKHRTLLFYFIFSGFPDLFNSRHESLPHLNHESQISHIRSRAVFLETRTRNEFRRTTTFWYRTVCQNTSKPIQSMSRSDFQ